MNKKTTDVVFHERSFMVNIHYIICGEILFVKTSLRGAFTDTMF